MVTFDCPWCTEPVELETPTLDELTCDVCSITVEIAPEPAARRIDRAA